MERFAAIALIVPSRGDHVEAARPRNRCRRHGVQIGTIDALLAPLCIGHGLVMPTADRDFDRIADWAPPRLWRAA